MTAPLIFDRKRLALRRRRAALALSQHVRPEGAGADWLLARVADDLMERLSVIRRSFADVAVVGAHTGLLGRRLRAWPGVVSVLETDAVAEALAMCGPLTRQVDEEEVVLPDASLDLIVSALAFETLNDLPGLIARLARSLRADGLMMVALAGGETLTELRQSLLAAESEINGGAAARVIPFADVPTLGALLQRARLALPVADSDRMTATYPHMLALLSDLRAMGATNVLSGHTPPLTRQTIARAAAIYAERFGADGGRIRATFDIVTLTGWAAHASQQVPLRPGSATARLADALQTKEHRMPGGRE